MLLSFGVTGGKSRIGGQVQCINNSPPPQRGAAIRPIIAIHHKISLPPPRAEVCFVLYLHPSPRIHILKLMILRMSSKQVKCWTKLIRCSWLRTPRNCCCDDQAHVSIRIGQRRFWFFHYRMSDSIFTYRCPGWLPRPRPGAAIGFLLRSK